MYIKLNRKVLYKEKVFQDMLLIVIVIQEIGNNLVQIYK